MLKRTGLMSCPGGTRTTALDVPFLSPWLVPPPSPFYGAVSKQGFRTSRLVELNGKPWQLRTVMFNGEFYIASFCINSGGVKSKAPIVGAPLLQKIGALPADRDRAAWDNKLPNNTYRVQVPSPLGELTAIMDWDHVRNSSQAIDERYNLIGHGFSGFIFQVHVRACDVRRGRTTFELAVDDLIADCPGDIVNYVGNPHNRMRVARELTAMINAQEEHGELHTIAESWTK